MPVLKISDRGRHVFISSVRNKLRRIPGVLLDYHQDGPITLCTYPEPSINSAHELLDKLSNRMLELDGRQDVSRDSIFPEEGLGLKELSLTTC